MDSTTSLILLATGFYGACSCTTWLGLIIEKILFKRTGLSYVCGLRSG